MTGRSHGLSTGESQGPPCFSPPTCLQNYRSQLKYRIKTHRDLTILAYVRELNTGESIAVMCSTCEKEISVKESSLNVFHAAYFSQLPKSVTYITALNSLFHCSEKQLDPPTNGLLYYQ